MIALSNAWGLFLIILFLGYGLVSVPHSCFQNANIDRRYAYQMFKLSLYERNYERAIVNMDELTRDALTVSTFMRRPDMKPYIAEILANCPEET